MRRRTMAENEVRRELTGRRQIGRGDWKPSLQRRLQEASREIENYSQYDYILVNEKVEPAIDVLQAIVKAERLKRSPQPPRRRWMNRCWQRPRWPSVAHMIEQVQAILATFAVSSSHTTSHATTE